MLRCYSGKWIPARKAEMVVEEEVEQAGVRDDSQNKDVRYHSVRGKKVRIKIKTHSVSKWFNCWRHSCKDSVRKIGRSCY